MTDTEIKLYLHLQEFKGAHCSVGEEMLMRRDSTKIRMSEFFIITPLSEFLLQN